MTADTAPPETAALSGRLEDGVHRFWLRVYYEDTDAAGIVYYANYLRFAERARTEMLRCLGIGQRTLRDDHGLAFAVRAANLDYRAPARLDDLLELRQTCTAFSRVQLTIRQRVLHAEDRRELADITVRVVVLDRSGRPARLPRAIAEAVQPYTDTSPSSPSERT
jgi:acyl-CoA thioester hydrolase